MDASPLRVNNSTLKVYAAAIAAYNAPLGGLSVGKSSSYTFPPVLRSEAYAKWWIRMLSYNLEFS